MCKILACTVVVLGLLGKADSRLRAEEDDEVVVAVDKLPKSVVDSVQSHFPGAKIKKAMTEKGDDDVLYEVSFQVNGHLIEVTLEQNGEIEEVERTVELKDVPSAVLELVAKKYPDSQLMSVEAIFEMDDQQEELEYYEVQVQLTDKKTIEVKVKYEVEIVGKDAESDDE